MAQLLKSGYDLWSQTSAMAPSTERPGTSWCIMECESPKLKALVYSDGHVSFETDSLSDGRLHVEDIEAFAVAVMALYDIVDQKHQMVTFN